MRNYATKKVQGLPLDYPRIIEAKVLLDVRKKTQHFAEVVLYCADHITIEADTTSRDMYASIDETMSKIARRMRKFKTRMLKSHRPKRKPIVEISEAVYSQEAPEQAEEEEIEPVVVQKESCRIRSLAPDEAILELEMSERPFVLFNNIRTGDFGILYRRRDGDYGVIEPNKELLKSS
jgi:putative sigma-54 modulation protein